MQDARAFAAAAGPDSGSGARPTTAAVVPSAAGVRVLRTCGKRHMVAEWERRLLQHGHLDAASIDWRLTEELPASAMDLARAGCRPAWMPIHRGVMLEHGARALRCLLRVPYDMAIFQGHFPSAPIVPGVMQIGWAVDLARAHGLADGPLTGIGAAKFRRLVRPGMSLVARMQRGPGTECLQFRYECGDTVVTIGRLRFGVERD